MVSVAAGELFDESILRLCTYSTGLTCLLDLRQSFNLLFSRRLPLLSLDLADEILETLDNP
jgi:hypothetical protein